MNRLKNVSDETDDADRVLIWENDLQFKKVKKSQYMILQYPPYRNIMITSNRDFGIAMISYRKASGDSHSYSKHMPLKT